uniref:Odorant receptor n=1 Tax=Manduca sexta TaxID=7130 RepID=A0A5K8B0W6_MANSE|nr:TPA: Olfactory receptor 47 [Manduca sexta]
MQIIKIIKMCRDRLFENSCVNLLRIIDFLPSLAGFSLRRSKFSVTFWIIHTVLLFYVYVSGTIIYQKYYAKEFVDLINSFFNISIFILIFVNSWWLLSRRSTLKELLDLVIINDDHITESGRLSSQHLQLLNKIKKILFACYVFHFVNDVCIFIPSRTVIIDDFVMASCVGLKPQDSSLDRIICMGILTVQEITSIMVVASYDMTLLFLFSHTTAMFQILYEDVTNFRELAENYYDSSEMKSAVFERLKNLLIRHSSILRTVQKMQDVYSVVVGIGFGLNAISMCLFFVLPIDVCLNFAPLIFHSLFVFFLYCYQGQRLTTASEKFEIAVYSCGWEHLGVRDQKTILLMLIQAQKPVIMMAAGVIPIRIRTFAYTLQNIYKFVTLFKI